VLADLAPPVARAKETASAALGTTRFQAEFEAGQCLSRDAAIRLALGDPAQVPDADSGRPGSSPLSKREADVIHLVADGLRNKQIAAHLLISEHPVDSQIRNVLNKLGFSSRAEIAA